MLKSWQLVLRSCARFFLAGGVVTYSALAPALGLGEITLHSALNQPFRADIALVDAAGLEQSELTVSLASAEEFSRAGVERAAFLSSLKFTPILRGNRRLIQVTSSKPVNEPFLNFLVQLNQPNGRLLREYTVLIDPPGSADIVPADEEPVTPSSAFPSVQPATVPPATTKTATTSAGPVPSTQASMADSSAGQLAEIDLHNRQLQASIDKLNARLEGQDEQIVEQKKQLAELHTQWLELREAAGAATVIAQPPSTDWRLMVGMPAIVALLMLAWLIRRQRQRTHPETAAPLPWGDASNHADNDRGFTETAFNEQSLQDIRSSIAKQGLCSPVVTTVVAATPVAIPDTCPDEEYQLNLDDLSMHTSQSPESAQQSPKVGRVDIAGLSLSLEPLSLDSLNLEPGAAGDARR